MWSSYSAQHFGVFFSFSFCHFLKPSGWLIFHSLLIPHFWLWEIRFTLGYLNCAVPSGLQYDVHQEVAQMNIPVFSLQKPPLRLSVLYNTLFYFINSARLILCKIHTSVPINIHVFMNPYFHKDFYWDLIEK